MHRKSKHQVRVHDFASAAKAIQERQGERYRAGLSFWRACLGLAIGLLSAGFYAILVRFGVQPIYDLPVWAPALAAQIAGFLTGVCALLVLRSR